MTRFDGLNHLGCNQRSIYALLPHMIYNCQWLERSIYASSTLIERPEKQKRRTCKKAWPEMGEGKQIFLRVG